MFLERTTDTVVFSIYTNTRADLRMRQSTIASWRTPSLALLRGTVPGAADYTFFSSFNWSGNNRYVIRNGDYVEIPRSQWRVLPMEEQVDAVLYLGPPSMITFEELSPTLCEDPDYLKMRLDRIALTPFPDQSLQRLCEGLEQE